MKRNAILLIVILLIGSIIPSNAFAMEQQKGNSVNGEKTSYYFIQFNGEGQEITISEETTLKLTGWQNNEKASVLASFNEQEEALTMNVSEELQTVKLTEDQSIHYRIVESDASQVEEVQLQNLTNTSNLIMQNENGTSIEEVKTIDSKGTIIENLGFVYYDKDETNQNVVITKEQYDSINSSNELAVEEVPPEDENLDEEKAAESQQTNEVSLFSARSLVQQPAVQYVSYVKGIGWQEPALNGQIAGTSGEGKRLEALQITLKNAPYPGGISYKTHVQSYGWLSNSTDGDTNGKIGEGKRVEAIQVSLTGEMANHFDIYYRVHSQHYGWLDWAKNGQSAGTEGFSKRLEAIEMILVEKGGQAPGPTEKPLVDKTSVVYSTHVESYGWMDSVADGKMSGTEGQAKRLEAIKINLEDAPYSGSITYSTHVQGYGWLANKSNGEISGTSGEKKRMEAIKVQLTGELAKHYDIYYRVHSQTFGWLDWAKNGNPAGTEGLTKRLESIEIALVKKGEKAPGPTTKSFVTKPSVEYSTHVQSYGWMSPVKDGTMSGTNGKAKRLEAIKINLKNAPFSGDITYSTHVQGYGWMADKSNGAISGTSGQQKRIEAIKINLTGELAKHYDIYYRVHSQTFGWLGWAKNGMKAGSEGRSKRLEAIEIKLVPKGQGEPVSEEKAFKKPFSIFLDPGHGGSDSGAVAGGYKEADLNLSVAKKVQSILLSRGYTVYMSRFTNTTVSLLERSQMANDLEADIFVSIHHNSTGSSTTSANGIEAFYYGYNPEYQPQINGAMHNNLDRVMKSVELTKIIQDRMVANTGATNRGTAGKSFSVIRESAMPATLLELGFINNPNERQKLVTSAYQDKLAKAIADGIDQYYKSN
ncbi:N-acetylmuramoyl-L-alanine amidase [Metabacillus malikii]|uniref:N-acetylmuramoyl-L-alanine amidase n=1 Tax=Metabacillus malikii TaxID=1504265 RepID=A0ABT9ZKE9_9BACI|nr:N-acetylmuramoyl-L-alanine amidase [Metabacillus malikii]MDQ0232768.1 N-acetylmuramoyl-L-alanine amidase [Metabacillus malikii]